MSARKPSRQPPPSEMAKRLRAANVTAILTKLQRQAERRGQVAEHLLLAAVLTWVNETCAVAGAAERRIDLTEVYVPAEVRELLGRLRLEERRR